MDVVAFSEVEMDLYYWSNMVGKSIIFRSSVQNVTLSIIKDPKNFYFIVLHLITNRKH